jgi:Family of unknown function (DUF5675)
MLVSLLRQSTGDQGTIGRIFFLGDWLFTLELPWKDDENDVSCVRAGTFDVKWLPHKIHGFCYQILVSGRTGVLIHSANYAGDKSKGYYSQLLGCVALGKKTGIMKGQKAILLSHEAVDHFNNAMNKQPFTLQIGGIG